MDRIEQRMRQLRVSDGSAVWDDLEGMPVANLSAKFRMPDIESGPTLVRVFGVLATQDMG
ncbi:hypothetical protein AAG906_005831 [Vitis piasezkii]